MENWNHSTVYLRQLQEIFRQLQECYDAAFRDTILDDNKKEDLVLELIRLRAIMYDTIGTLQEITSRP